MQKFIKTIINAVQAWTSKKIEDKAAELDTRISESQADWSQNNPENDGYIRNRPFYEESIEVVWVEEQTITINENGYAELTRKDGVDWPNVQSPFEVIFDNVSYKGTTFDDIDACTHTDFTTVDGYKITIVDASSLTTSPDLAGEHIIKITYTKVVTHIIDEKYLPEQKVWSVNNKTGHVRINASDIDAAPLSSLKDKMNKTNPTGTGSFSMNRKLGTTIGVYSHAEGYNTTASGDYSHAEGAGTTASGSYSHAEGKFNISNTANTYAHIVGNGASDTKRSNAHTLDWDGNAWYQGDVYVGSTSGTNKDEGSKKLATEEYVDTAFEDLTTSGGFVVQAEPPEDKNVLWVDTDDETVEVEIPSGGGGSDGSLDWEFINSITLSEEIISSTVEITTDANGKPFAYKELFVIVSGQAPAGKSNFITWIPNSSWSTGEFSNSIIKLPEYKIILTAQAVIMDLPDGTHFLHQYEPYRPYAEPLNNAPISIISNKAIWQSFIKYKWQGTFAVGTQFILYGRNKV